MATDNNNNIQINTFTKGMNTDFQYSSIQEGQYLYAENLRNYNLNASNGQQSTNSTGSIKAIEGCKTAFKTPLYKYTDSDELFVIDKILGTTSIRQYGIVVAEDADKNWIVVRFVNNIGTSGEFNNIDDCKIIFRSYNPKLGGLTKKYDQLCGEKVSIVSTWETKDNIKIYIADGEHFMKIINIAESNDDYNLKNSGNVKLFEQFPDVTTLPIIFCGLTYGKLNAGSVQYAYRFYKKHGNVSQMSVPTKPIALGIGFGDGDKISKNSKGGLQTDVINCGVKLKIPLESDNPQLDHILIYRIFHYKNGQTPDISLIYDRSIQVQTENGSSYMLYTDNGVEAIQQISLDEFNNISGVYIIPKVIESKNDILFAANIKDDQATLDEIGRLFDARAFRANREGDVIFKNGNITVTENINKLISRRSLLDYNKRVEEDLNDQFNPYNDINKRFSPKDDLCKYDNVGGKLYFGGRGNYISWRFVLAKVVGDYTPSKEGQIGQTISGINYTYDGSDDVKWSKCTNTPQLYTIYELMPGINVSEDAGNANFTTSFEPNNDNGTYANPCISYGLRSLRRDELYRYAIILYNKKGEHTPALWIDDIRTPSANESQFETFCANGEHLQNGKFVADKVELTVHPLGIQFNVDIDAFNENVLKNKYKDEYEDKKIVSYEIIRCHRDTSDIQTIAQGVLSRPIKRQKNRFDYTLLDNVYTPTGSLTTQQFWAGHHWVARNQYWYEDSPKDWAGDAEADNFDNHDTFQFICPEAVYTQDTMFQLAKNTHSYLQPISYIFGHYGGTQDLDTEGKLKNGTYPQLMRSFDSLADLNNSDTNWGTIYDATYNYVGSSVCGHNLAMPPKVYSDTIKKSTPLGNDYEPGFTNTSSGYYYKDLYDPTFDDTGQNSAFDTRCIVGNSNEKIYTGGDRYKRTYLQGLQGMMIDQQFSRNQVSYYYSIPWDVNKYYGTDIGSNETVKYRKHGSGKGIVTYKKIGTDNTKYEGWTSTEGLRNILNKNPFGYTKLYQTGNNLYQRIYKTKTEISENIQVNIDTYGLPFSYDTYDMSFCTESYEVKKARGFSQIEWSNLIDSQTKDNKTSYSAKYTDYALSVGTEQFCNVVESGTYNDTLKTLTSDKTQGWFCEDKDCDRLEDYDNRGAIFGTGGSCIVLNLENKNNILYKTICTDTINRSLTTSYYNIFKGYSDQDYKLDQSLLKKTPGANLKCIVGMEPDSQTREGTTSEKLYTDSSAYDYVDYIKSKSGKKVPIYRSSIDGTFLCNLRQSTVPYGGYTYSARCLNQYVSFGDIRQSNVKQIDVFDGDCYIQPFEYQSCHKTYHKNMLFTMTAGLFYSIPVETNINLAYTSGLELSREDKNECSNLQEKPASMMDMWVQEDPEYEYNTAYSVQPKVSSVEASDLSKDSNTINTVDYRCCYSDAKVNNENYDNWTVFKAANFLDADDRYGEITNLRSFNNLLLFWQQHAVGQFSVNERTQISDDSGKPLVLGTGGVLSRYDYIGQQSGMEPEEYCDCISQDNIYWYDDSNNEIKTLNGTSMYSMTKQLGVQNIMHERNGIVSPVMFYDNKYNEVISRVLLRGGQDESIAYNENVKAFTSVYTIPYKERVSFPNGVYLLNVSNGNLHINQWDVKDNDPIKTVLRYVVNAQPLITKVFDNQEIVTENPVDEYQYEMYDYKWKTDLYSSDNGIETTAREGNFRYAVPRVGNEKYGNRMRGKYMICEMTSKPVTPYDLKNVSISYIMTKFRKSCS